MSQTLPFINSIIQVGSNLDNFTEAVNWVREKLPSADAVPVISALTFYALVEKACEEDKLEESTDIIHDEILGDVEKKEIWERIRKRVQKLV